MTDHQPGPLLTCIVPVRNGASDLPAFLASVRSYCDAVVALDDGSTDATLAILEAEPLVTHIVRQPVRDGYGSWNDSRNRNALLKALAPLGTRWVLSLDADEVIEPGDAAALRAFLEQDAIPGLAYGFRNGPIYNEGPMFWPRYIWAYRLFHYQPGQTFPRQKLHFTPIPTSIPRERWMKTTLRMQHLGERTPARRIARFAKYLESDPSRRYQAAYHDSLRVVDEASLPVWLPRAAHLPVLLAEAEAQVTDGSLTDGQPALTVIILDSGSVEAMHATLASVGEQDVPEPVETIVVSPSADRVTHDGVRVVPSPEGATPGAMRNAGLVAARGTFVHFVEAGIVIAPGSLALRLQRHRQGYSLVSGALLPATPTPVARVAWACRGETIADDAGTLQGPGRHSSYARLVLNESGGFPEAVVVSATEVIDAELYRRGYLTFRDPAIVELLTTLPASGRALIAERARGARHRVQRDLRGSTQTGGYRAMDSVGRSLAESRRAFQSLPIRKLADMRWMAIAAGADVLATVLAVRRHHDGSLRGKRPNILVIIASDAVETRWIVQCDYVQQRCTAFALHPTLRLVDARADDPTSILWELPADRVEEVHALCAARLGFDAFDVIVGPTSVMQALFVGLEPGSRGEVAFASGRDLLREGVITTLDADGWRALGAFRQI